MFGSTIGDNRQRDGIWWVDKDGTEWAKATTAAAASIIGTEPFRPKWSLTGQFVFVRDHGR